MSHPHPFESSLAYDRGAWKLLDQVAWSVTDLGTTQGAILVERLRTLGGRLHRLPEHLQRLMEGAERLQIPLPHSLAKLESLCLEVVQRNAGLVESVGDVGLVLLASPGDPGIDRHRPLKPEVILHLSPLPFAQLEHWYRFGTHLHLSSVRNVPAACWSPSIKVRSRLQYYLADLEKAEATSSSTAGVPPAAVPTLSPLDRSVPVLLSTRGTITETSIANLIVVDREGVLRSPALDDILPGVSLRFVAELAAGLSYRLEYGDLYPDDLETATEVLMSGTNGCLWSAVMFQGKPIGSGKPGPLCRELQQAWELAINYSFTRGTAFES